MLNKLFRRDPEKTVTEEKNLEQLIDMQRMPQHIAIIMDGNGRWAQSKGLPRTFGHRAGVETLRETVKTCSKLGVKALTVYAFSTENWKRPVEEVNILMGLLIEYLQKEIEELHNQGVQIRFIGDIAGLALSVRDEIIRAREYTAANKGLILNIAVNYGGRSEIIYAIKNLLCDIESNKVTRDKITESVFADYLFTADSPEPDLLIRPSGDYRISNFLLWQLAYTEFWFSEVLWPDFSKDHLLQAIADFQQRERRFGGVKKKT